MTIGSLVSLSRDMGATFDRLKSLGLTSCQVCCWDTSVFSDHALARSIRALSEKTGVTISTFWCGWSGEKVWNFIDGPRTLGLVPEKTREQRTLELCEGADFAREMGVVQIATHMGFLPENPGDPAYTLVIEAIRRVAERCLANGQHLLFETGQETPVTLLRVIEDVGTGNLGVNFDAANLLLYGKANPLDALDIIGAYVRDTHIKDGEYPTDGRHLGVEKRFGDGRVGFPALIGKLVRLGYQGAFTVEREISGDEQIRDILYAKEQICEILKARLS